MSAVILDTFRLTHPDLPPEWDQVDPEVQEWLDKQVTPEGLPTQERIEVEDAIIAQRWYLVRNTHRAHCISCAQGILRGEVHDYITRACEARPFHGLNEVRHFWQEKVIRSGYPYVDFMSLRLGEEIIPISKADARRQYLKIQMRTKKDYMWRDFWSRYRRRYERYLRSIGWNPKMLTSAHWQVVMTRARREYVASEGR